MISKNVWKVLLAGNLAIIFFYWWHGSSGLLEIGLPGVLIAFGKLSGLLAATTVLLQFAFMGRTPWLERSFGLDKLSRIHQQNGRLSFLFIITHPILLTIGYSQLAGISLWQQYLQFAFTYEHVLWASIGLWLFAAVVGTSMTIVRSKWRYESWYFVHLLVYVAVFLSFWHQIEVGEDFLSSSIFYWYWIGLYTVVFTAHVLFRFGRPFYLFHKHDFAISHIERETHNAVSLYISGKNLTSFRIYPGQFMIVRFLTKGMWWQAHPFSLSMVPNGKELRITVKEVGDFTKKVSSLPVGTKMMIDGPYGIFTEWVNVSPKVLFIAGGIGITPVRSLMERMLELKKDTVLLYANKTEKDIVFQHEFARLLQKYSAKIIHILSDDAQYTGEKGKLDSEKIQRLVPDVAVREVYLCGPPPMMQSLIQTLIRLGVPHSRIHFEKFSMP